MEKIVNNKVVFTDQITQKRIEKILNRIEDMLKYITLQIDNYNYHDNDKKFELSEDKEF